MKKLAFAVWAAAAVACGPYPVEETEGQKEEVLNPSGPDIGIDVGRLRASVRVVTNGSVQQAEVAEGCAGGTTGRTLVRFDVKTPNFGPADIEFGQVTCRSTNTSAACFNRSCFDSPSCCCNGQNSCTASGGNFGNAFEFSCPHSHIHFKSFADYRLISSTTGAVAASGHKQSFCLMDIEGATTNSCPAFDRYTCGFQGIHAGCADVYSSALPCSYVDATGVPAGDYVLEVRMDPLDAINESNESNNMATANVRIGNPTPTPTPTTALFLVRDGISTAAEADAYYADSSPGFVAGSQTLEDWQARFIDPLPSVSAFYRNKNELGFWREMTCTQTLERGAGGCFVRNWADSADPDIGRPNLGTVAMRLDEDGRTQFFAFAPDGRLSRSAALDDEGQKFLPRLCTNCHGGEYRGIGSDPDLGSIFREFEPSQLLAAPGVSAATAEAEWFALNQAVRSANQNVRGEAEGGPFGIDAAADAMATYVDEIYLQTSPPVSRPIDDVFHLPPSWQTGATAAERQAKADIWKQLVNPYCMTCHRTSSFSYDNYAKFATLAVITDGRPLLRRYIEVDPNDPNRASLAFMPQSKLQWQNLSTDADALLSIENWLDEANNRPPVAAAGADQVVAAGATVALSGAGSTDPDGDPLTFQWQVVTGPAVTFSPSATARDVTFVAPAVTANTDIVLRLTVRDTRLGATDDTVKVTVAPVGDRLVVNSTDTPRAIPDNSATGITSSIAVAPNRLITDLKVTVTIDHTWRGDLRVTLIGPGGFSKILADRSGGSADNIYQTFLVPDAVGRSTAGTWQLKVADLASLDTGTLRSWSLDFGVGALPDNRPPIAVAGPDRTVSAGDPVPVVLSALGSSDPDGDPITYRWVQTSGPAVGLSPSTTARDVNFGAPFVDVNTVLGFRLEVTDSHGARGEAVVAITVTPPEGGRIEVAATDVPINIPDANPTGVTSSIVVTTDDDIAEMTVMLDIRHTWRGDLRVVLVGPGGFTKVLHDRAGGSADDLVGAFAIPEAVGHRTGGTWQLKVSDSVASDVGTLRSWSVVFEVGHTHVNRAPSASAGSDRTVMAGATVSLSAAGSSDPDGDALTYQWTRTSGPAVTFAPSSTARDVSFVAPAVTAATTIGIRLTVNDGHGATAQADITVNVNPVGGGTFTVSATDLPKSIPDANTTGITSSIAVTQSQTIRSLSVTVVIQHTWIGDLRVVLTGPGGFQAVLHDRAGNDADNINQTFTVPAAVGRSTAGTWQLRVTDLAAADVGVLQTFRMTFGT